MKRMYLATAAIAVLMSSAVSFAQEAPAVYGNGFVAVSDDVYGGPTPGTPDDSNPGDEGSGATVDGGAGDDGDAGDGSADGSNDE